MVAQAVLYSPAGRQKFRERCGVLFTNLLQDFTNRIEALHHRLRPVVAQCGTNAVKAHERAVAALRARVKERLDHLRLEFSAPAPLPTLLEPGAETPLTNWVFSVEKGKAADFLTNSIPDSTADGAGSTGDRPFLQARLEENALAGWQCRTLLPAGIYRISARVSTDQPTFRGPTCPVALSIYGLEEVQLETVTRDATHAELTAIFPMPRSGPEEAVFQCRIRGGAQAQLWTLTSVVLTRLQ